MKIAVVGSRTFNKKKEMFKILDAFIFEHFWKELKQLEIVSGGQKGADTLATIYATKRNFNLRTFHAYWTKYGLSAGPRRNQQIADYSDMCFAFIDKPIKKSRGTYNTVLLFKELEKPVSIYLITHTKNINVTV